MRAPIWDRLASSVLWSPDEALADLAAVDAVLLPLAPGERPAAAARWFAARYGPERGAQVFVLFVRLARWLSRNQAALAGRERDRAFLARLLDALGASGGAAVASVPAEVPPEDEPEG